MSVCVPTPLAVNTRGFELSTSTSMAVAQPPVLTMARSCDSDLAWNLSDMFAQLDTGTQAEWVLLICTGPWPEENDEENDEVDGPNDMTVLCRKPTCDRSTALIQHYNTGLYVSSSGRSDQGLTLVKAVDPAPISTQFQNVTFTVQLPTNKISSVLVLSQESDGKLFYICCGNNPGDVNRQVKQALSCDVTELDSGDSRYFTVRPAYVNLANLQLQASPKRATGSPEGTPVVMEATSKPGWFLGVEDSKVFLKHSPDLSADRRVDDPQLLFRVWPYGPKRKQLTHPSSLDSIVNPNYNDKLRH